MSLRQSLPVIGRLVTVAAMVAVAGITDCARFGGATRDGALDESVYPAGRVRATLGQVMSGAAGTYIDRLLADRDSTIERWPNHLTEPLTVWIDTSSELSGVLSHYPQTVRSAFVEWAGTGIPLRFTFVSSARNADIRVRWTDRLPHKTGSTTWRTDRSGVLTSGDIVLATHISDGYPLDARGMRAIALHEVGHALGLSHSLDSRDIMAPLVRVDELSASDRGTIKLLYSFPAGPLQ
jgi:predicted Zn-dependent protease